MGKNTVTVMILLGMGVCWAVGEYGTPVWAAGNFKVVDGDSLEKGTERIRILNIDAPEYKQFCYDVAGNKYMCGQKALEYMQDLVGKGISCQKKDTDRYGRSLSECYQKDGTDIGRQMVLSGWAVAYGSAYLKEEREAKENKRGIWQGRFMRPELFRALHKSRKTSRK